MPAGTKTIVKMHAILMAIMRARGASTSARATVFATASEGQSFVSRVTTLDEVFVANRKSLIAARPGNLGKPPGFEYRLYL
jgi:hypothetical protein